MTAAPTSQSPQSPAPADNRFQAGLRIFFRALLRLIIIVLVALLIGLGIYAGIRVLYPRYIVPIQTNTQHLEQLQQQVSDQNQQQADRLAQLQTRIAALESQHTLDRETVAGLQSQVADLIKSQQASSKRLDQLNQVQSTLTVLQSQIGQNQADTKKINQQLTGPNSPLAGLEREITILKALELLQRSRLSLAQNNLGLARQDLFSLHDLLTGLRAQGAPEQINTVDQQLARLDLALANLPAYPVMASQDLEILWELVSIGLPGDPAVLPTSSRQAAPAFDNPTPSPTPTPFDTPTPFTTPTMTPQVTSTPTAFGPSLTPGKTASPTP